MTRPLSIPEPPVLPRTLNQDEQRTLMRVADVLVPAHGDANAASGEPDYLDCLHRALRARADAFDLITGALHACATVPTDALFDRLKRLDAEDPDAFQALSTVIAGAWLLTEGVRARLGYHGPTATRAKLEDALEDITSGLLDPVTARGNDGRWRR